MVSGVSPFYKPEAGRLTSTVNWPGTAGLMVKAPFWPVSSQLPIMSAAAAGRRSPELRSVAASAPAKAIAPKRAANPGEQDPAASVSYAPRPSVADCLDIFTSLVCFWFIVFLDFSGPLATSPKGCDPGAE